MLSRYFVIAFVTGAAIMVGEIAAARAIAPHFGTSIVVWTNVIGVVLGIITDVIGALAGNSKTGPGQDRRTAAALV